MAKAQQAPSIPVTPGQESQALVPVEEQSLSLADMFARQINGRDSIKSITLKKLLTRPLISMAYTRELIFECKGEMREMDLPVSGRADKPLPATVIDGFDHSTKTECTLVLNAMMMSALLASKPPLTGRFFGFSAGDIKADKRYRVVDVVEIEVER